jgi:hypothetical protein
LLATVADSISAERAGLVVVQYHRLSLPAG